MNHSVRAMAITSWLSPVTTTSKALHITIPDKPLHSYSDVLSRSFNTSNVSSQPESSAALITVRQNNSVMVSQEKTTSFLQSVFSSCTVHGSINVIFNNQNP